tara:strand:+ start:438 stop:632 length:195 start_codon:yes stop_codon:yes gene_type:complete
MSSKDKKELYDMDIGEVKQEITHDFILDVYETSVGEEDPEVRASIIAACQVLSENLGTYLVEKD